MYLEDALRRWCRDENARYRRYVRGFGASSERQSSGLRAVSLHRHMTSVGIQDVYSESSRIRLGERTEERTMKEGVHGTEASDIDLTPVPDLEG